jgi:DNA (cytosine-5)-methyltransferase 1
MKGFKLNTIDLFSGCGGMSLGFQKAGFNILAAFDNWEPAINVYKENFNHPIYNTDLSNDLLDYSIFTAHNPDIIIGGPPCQDFSSAGKRDEKLGRADLTIYFARIISKVKPKFFVMENVERIIKSKTLKDALKIFAKSGYHLSQKVLDASFCGVPQKRKRFFLIGTLLNAPDNFLDYYLEKNLSSKSMTIYDYIGDKFGIEYYYRHPRTYNRRGIFSIYEPSPTVRGVNRPVPPNYKKHPGDLCEPDSKLRPLTTRERSILQTFPEDFKLNSSKTNLEQMIGNAVPVNLAKYVASALKEFIDDFINEDVIYTSLNIQTKVYEKKNPARKEAQY